MFCVIETHAQVYPEVHHTYIKINAQNLASKMAEAEAAYVVDPTHALQLCGLLLDYATQEQDVELFLRVNRIAGNTYYHHGFFSLWEEHCEMRLSKKFVTENTPLKARLHEHLGIALEMQGKYAASLGAYLKSRTLVREMDDMHEYHTSGLNMAMLYEKVKQIDKSLELLESAKAYFEEINDSSFLALTYQNLGMIHDRREDYESMELYTRKSMDLYSNLGDSIKMLDLHLNMAVVYLNRREIEHVSNHLNEAKLLLSPTSPMVNLYNFLAANKAHFQKNYMEADSLYRLAIKGFKEYNRAGQVIESYRGQILVSIAVGNTEHSEALLKELIDFQKEHFNNTLLDKFAEYELKYETKRLEDAMEVLALEYENQMIRVKWLFIFLGFVTLAASLIAILNIRLNNAFKKLYILNKASTKNSGLLTIVKRAEEQDEEESEDDELRIALYNDAVKILTDRQLYKDPKLSVQDLATALNSNTKYLSQAINNCSAMNFNAFINAFRVNEAKKILSQPENSALTMEAIATMSGFSQRSQLYRVFSSSTGLTPGQFKKLNKEE